MQDQADTFYSGPTPTAGPATESQTPIPYGYVPATPDGFATTAGKNGHSEAINPPPNGLPYQYYSPYDAHPPTMPTVAAPNQQYNSGAATVPAERSFIHYDPLATNTPVIRKPRRATNARGKSTNKPTPSVDQIEALKVSLALAPRIHHINQQIS